MKDAGLAVKPADEAGNVLFVGFLSSLHHAGHDASMYWRPEL